MKYRIELTDEQLHVVLRAVNLMMRTGMGQTDDLTEWLVTMGDNIKFDTSTEIGKRVFENYYRTREAIRPVLDGVMRGCWQNSSTMKSITVRELETVYDVLRHQEWLDAPTKLEWDVRGREPMQWGNEPIPKIERVMEEK
nr:MAG TPA: hypothetical protein [Caudoviricetes sp.]